MRPRPLVAALLLLALPTPDAAALGLEVAPLPPVPTDGTPFEINLTLTDLPTDPVELKAWIGGEAWQASRTWNGSAWIRADRYALTPPAGADRWSTWLRLQVNPEARHHPELVEEASALLGVRLRTSDETATWQRPVELLHRPVHKPVALAPDAAAAAYDPDGRLVARTHNPGMATSVQDLAIPAEGPVTVCLAQRCRPHTGLQLAAVGPEQVAVMATGPEPIDLAGSLLATPAWRCPLAGEVVPGHPLVIPLDDPGSPAGCPEAAGEGEVLQLVDLGQVLDEGEVPGWGWLARYQQGPHAWAAQPLPASAWPTRPRTLEVDGWADAFATRAAGLSTVLATIDGAQHRLTVASYLLTNDLVFGALARAAERGVDVTLVLEPEPIGGRPVATDRAIETLEAAGVTVRWSRGPWSDRGVQHAKVVVADGHVVLVMTENLTRSGLPADGHGNLGLGLGIANRTLAQRVEGLFDRDGPATAWHPAGWGPFSGQVTLLTSPENVWSEQGVLDRLARSNGPIRGLSLTASPAVGETTNPLLDALVDASSRVPVRVLLNGVGHEDRVDGANRPALAYLSAHPSRGDLEARLSTPALGRVHAKALIGPDWAMVGSSNWGAGGLVVNREVNLLVEEPGVAEALAVIFDDAWATHAGPLRPAGSLGGPVVLVMLLLTGRGWARRCWDRAWPRAGSPGGSPQ